MSVRKAFPSGPLNAVCWTPTDSMLVDSCTKAMKDKLWHRFYQTGKWSPSELQVCRQTEGGERSLKTHWTEILCTWLVENISSYELEEICEEDEEIFLFAGHMREEFACFWGTQA